MLWRRKKSGHSPPTFHLETLERRILFSADAVWAAMDTTKPEPDTELVMQFSQNSEVANDDAVQAGEVKTKELIIVDSALPDRQQLLDDLSRKTASDTQVVLLDAQSDALTQISNTLAQQHDLTALHVMSNGSSGVLELGGQRIQTLDLLSRADEVMQWRSALAPGAELVLHGCEVTADGTGRQFVDSMARLTGADVNASTASNDDGTWLHDDFAVPLNDQAAFNNAPSDLSSGIELNTDGGNDAYLTADDGGVVLGGLEQVTVEVHFAASRTDYTPLVSYAAATGNDFLVELIGDGTARVHVNSNLVTLTGIDYDSLMDGQRHSLAVSWDNTNGDVFVYVDGLLVDSATGLSANQLIAGSAGAGSLVFGQEQDNVAGGFASTGFFSGTLFDIRIWNEVRSQPEVLLNHQYKFDSASLPSGLVANWQMDGFNGSNEVIEVVSGNHLTVAHATGAGFIASTPVDDLHISENANNGATVGFVVPSDPDVSNDIVSDGLFREDTSSPVIAAPNSFGGWTVTQGDVNVSTTWEAGALGGAVIDLNGFQLVPGAIAQSLATEPGQQYQVVFALSGNFAGGDAVKDMRVIANGTSADFQITQPDGWASNNMQWSNRSMTFTADSTTTVLEFASLDPGNAFGAAITDVRVIEIPAAVTTILNNDPALSYDAATGKFYRFVDSPTDFNTALAAATGSELNGISGQLVTIRSQYENDLVRQHVLDSNNEIWIGTHDANNDGNWNWLEGSTESNEPFWTGGVGGAVEAGFFAPEFRQSEYSGEDYARVISGGQWSDAPANGPFSYIVEWDAGKVLSNFTFILADDAGGRFAIDSNTGEITVADGLLLDYEIATSHDVKIQVTDAAGNSFSETMTIAVDNEFDVAQTVPGAQSVVEDGTLIFSGSNVPANAITVSDSIAGSDSPMRITLSVNNGVLTLSQTTGLSFVEGSQGSSLMVVDGIESDINAALNGLSFTPNANYNGVDTLNITTALGADLEGHYTFDGDVVDQSAGTANNGTLTDGATIVVDGQRGNVLDLAGATDEVTLSPMIPVGSQMTVSAWVNTNSTGSFQNVVALNNDFVLIIKDDGTVRGQYRNTAGSTWATTDGTENLLGTGWRHVAYTIDLATNTQQVYVDGVLAGETSYTDPIFANGAAEQVFGRNSFDNGQQFNGLLDEIRIYSRFLSADEIAALATQQTQISNSVAITVNAANDTPVGLPTITGVATEDQLLTVDTGGISDIDGLGSFNYQWLRENVDIAGATADTYTLSDADAGFQISVQVSYTDGEGTVEGLTSVQTAPVANVNDGPTGTVTINNTTPAEGDLLTASNSLADGDGLGTISYQWQRDGSNIPGAADNTYTTVQADVGAAISVVAGYTDGQGTAEDVSSAATDNVTNVNDAPTGTLTIDNTTPAEGDLLTASNTLADEDGLGTIIYQWQRDGSNIPGATGNTYTTVQADVGAAIRVVTSYTDDQGAAESVASTATANVTNVNDAPTGIVTIDNTTPAEGNLLTASNTLADEDGIGSISYQWQRDGSNIPGATGAVYTIVQADVGTAISVAASYTDSEGTSEGPLTSAQTAVATNINDTPVGMPVINGTATEGQTLTADTTGIADSDGLGAFSYQWLRDNVIITGAISNTYTLVDADVGAQIKVLVSYTDDQGTVEGPLISDQTAIVNNVGNAPLQLAISNGSVVENTDTSGGFSVGQLSTVDVDTNDTFTYSVVGGVDVSVFMIGGAGSDELILTDGVLNFEVQSSYSVTIRTTDSGGLVYDQALMIAVIDVNDAPVIDTGYDPVVVNNGSSSNSTVSLSVNENQTDVLRVSAVDEDARATHVYRVTGGTDQSAFSVNTSTGELKFVSPPDFEVQERFEVEVTVTDNGGLSAVKTLLVNVQNVNESPMAQGDILEANENQRLIINPVSSLLSNDTDPEQQALRLVGFSQPQNGKLTVDEQGFLVYEPDADFVGRDGFDYIVEDTGGLRVSAQVWLDVTALSDPVTAAAQPTTYGTDKIGELNVEQPVNTRPHEPSGAHSTIQPVPSASVAVGSDKLVASIADTSVNTVTTQDLFTVAAYADISEQVPVSAQQPPPARALVPTISSLLEQLLEYDLAELDVNFALQGFEQTQSIELRDAILVLRNQIDQMMDQTSNESVVTTVAPSVIGASLTAGMVTWVLRSGLLISITITTAPLWRPLDPVPILVQSDDDEPWYEQGAKGDSSEQPSAANDPDSQDLKHG